ncbi:SCP2 domain-containing protein [Methylothermus subterraneus]|nr:hypothetical conserved protein [uncultured Gammaproteobacteria bacterium]
MLAQAVLSEALSAALRRVLALDPKHARLLEPLAGKVIAVEPIPFGRLTLSFTLDTVLVLPDFSGPVDLSLKGSPLAFARLRSDPQGALFQGEIEVRGDVRLARRLQILFQRLDLDWESYLADLLGDRFGRGLADSLRAAAAWNRHAWRTFQQNLAEFLQEETRVLPAPLEAEDLYRQIGCLRDDAARLEARVQRLKAYLNAT